MPKTQELQLEESINKYYPFLMEIRKRLLFLATIFVVSAVGGFFYYERIVRIIVDFLSLDGINIVFTSPFQYLNLAVDVAFLVAVIVIFPVIIYQIITFLRPALKKSEYNLMISLIPIGFFLFIFGFIYGVVMMRYVMQLFFEKSVELNIGNMLDISSLLSKIVSTSTFMGLAFEFPIVVTALVKLKVIKLKVVSQQRVYAWFASLIFAAMLPPTDLLSLALLTMPLVILFEFTLLFNRLFSLRK
ncbi:MAG TPA: twin-arginine translocase subunit TatC [Patescibacteria group bacterium]|nr:twin-arginine translocase subunit TatC [Patescibacteria group bacterium]